MMKKSRPSCLTGRLAAILLGAAFLASGLLKAVDPVGTGLVVESYLGYLGLYGLIGRGFCIHLWGAAALTSLPCFLGTCLSFFEATLGVMLLTGFLRRLASCLSGILLCGFSILMLSLWADGADISCGCFGQLVPMGPKASFFKNMVLLALCLLSLRAPRKAFGWRTAASELAVAAVCIVFQYTLPPFDVTEAAKGRNVELLGLDIPTDGNVAVMSFWGREDSARASRFRSEAALDGYYPVVLTCEDADRRTLMTLNRLNGGVTYMQDGVILKKTR